MTRVAVLVLTVVVVGAGAWVFLHKSPKAMTGTNGRLLALRRQHAIVVPDVRSLTLVDAKSAFDQAGLAWTVVGPVGGYHANVVVAETPAPGTRLVDTGAPLVKLRLRRSGLQTGAPQQHSSQPGTAVQVVGAQTTGVVAAATTTTAATTTAVRTTPPKTTPAKTTPPKATPAKTTPPRATTAVKTTPAKTTPAKTTPAKTTPAKTTPVKTMPAKTTVRAAAPTPPANAAGQPPLSSRPPAFVLPGGTHRERVGELPLPTRAAQLLRYMRAHKKPTNKVVRHWLVQHAWVTAGARFGWWHGAEALRTLIAADQLAESRWGIGYRNEEIARQALAFVHAQEARR